MTFEVFLIDLNVIAGCDGAAKVSFSHPQIKVNSGQFDFFPSIADILRVCGLSECFMLSYH